MDRKTGRHVWESPFEVSGCPSVDGQRVFVWRVAEHDRFGLVAVDIRNGREVWTAAGDAAASRRPWPTIAAFGGVAWSDDSHVVLLDGATGLTRWSHEISDDGALSVPVVNRNGLFVASSRTVQSLAAADGHILWHSDEDTATVRQIPPLVQCDENMLVVVRNTHVGRGMASCRDAATGALLWSREAAMPWHLVVAEGRVFLRGAHIQALDGQTGSSSWLVPMGGCSPIEVSGGCVYTVDGENHKGLYALRADTGKQVWTQQMISSCSGISVSGKMGYLSTQDGMLRAVVIRRGS